MYALMDNICYSGGPISPRLEQPGNELCISSAVKAAHRAARHKKTAPPAPRKHYDTLFSQLIVPEATVGERH